MSGFVVCTKCGTRIKAGRQHCLRCFEPLPDPDVPVRPPIWESLGLSGGQQAMVGGAVAVVIAALVAFIWSTWPERVADDTVAVAPLARTAAAPAAAAAAGSDSGERGSAAVPAIDEAPPAALSQSELTELESRRGSYEQALAKTPDDPEMLNNLGQVLMRLYRAEDAFARFERAVELAPARATYHFNLARAASDLGRRSRAIDELRVAVHLLPRDGATRYTLGLALQKANDHVAALAELEQAIALSPEDPKPHLAYALSLDQMGRATEALKHYRLYNDMRPTAPEAQAVKERIRTLTGGRP